MKLLVLSLFASMSAAYAVDVCEISGTGPGISATCTVNADEATVSDKGNWAANKVALTKILIEKGYELKGDGMLFVKP